MFRLALFAAVLAGPLRAADFFCNERNIQIVDGALQLARQWDPVFVDSFEAGLKDWKIENYANKLAIGTADEGWAGKCLLITNRGSKGDTAFEVASRPIRVRAGARCRLKLSWRATLSLNTLAGHNSHFMTQLQWLDSKGTALEPTPFRFGPAAPEWQALSLTGKAPRDTVSVVVRIGFDHPNLDIGDSLALDDICFEQLMEPAAFEHSGSMSSRPLRVTGKDRRIAWQADVPAGTRLLVQVASAPDQNGGPGEWSKLVESDALPSIFEDRPWVRYVATLETADPAKTPMLRSVTIGNVTDGRWQGRDGNPPTVAARSATRTADARAPIWFRLNDETGVDCKTVRAEFDDVDITPRVRFADGRYVYRPSAPLKPLDAMASLSRWRTSNHNGALTIERTARGAPAARPGFRITRKLGEVDTAFSIQSPPIAVVPRARYNLAYWSRHSLSLKAAMNDSKSFSGGVTWLGPDGAPLGMRSPIDFGPANTEWHRDVCELTAPGGAASAVIGFGFDTPNIFGGAFVDIAEIEFEGPRPVRRDDTLNLHRLTIHAADFAGNVLKQDSYLLIRPPRTKNIVTLRDDGMALVDGKPFFPIGLYSVWKKPFNNDSFDKAFGDLRAAGFNLAHTYSSARGPDFAEFYAAAQRHGIKLFVASSGGANSRNVESVVSDVAREESQPALLAWYLADDTASHVGSDELRGVTEAIHDVDPAHITVQADGVGAPPSSRYTDYVNSTDGFLPELYPIRGNGDKGVPQTIADMKTIQSDLAKAGTRRKTIWAIVQYFEGWGWPRFPTRQELWAMSYLSIIHGAHGITWYTYGGTGKNHGVTHMPEVWRNICDLAGELSKLQGILVERTGPQAPPPEIVSGPAKDALGYPSISALLKERGGRKYLLAANSANANVTVRFTAAGAKKLALPFENRQLEPDGGGFTDTFGPYGVHVYQWGSAGKH